MGTNVPIGGLQLLPWPIQFIVVTAIVHPYDQCLNSNNKLVLLFHGLLIGTVHCCLTERLIVRTHLLYDIIFLCTLIHALTHVDLVLLFFFLSVLLYAPSQALNIVKTTSFFFILFSS